MPLFFEYERHVLSLCKMCPEFDLFSKHKFHCGYRSEDDIGPCKINHKWTVVLEDCPRFLEHMMNGKGILCDEKYNIVK